MLSQGWVNNGEVSLAAVSYQPEVPKFKAGVLLIAGFSQSMCDNDYFMAKLARRLAGAGLYVLQVDPRGHGDSPGNLEDVTLDTLREDLRSAIQFGGEQSGGKMIGIGRGLSALLLAEEDLHPGLGEVAGIAPYCLAPEVACALFPQLGPDVIDSAALLTGDDYKHFSDFDPEIRAFFEALGVGLLINFLGQKISGELIRQLMKYELDQVFRTNPEARFWLMPKQSDPTGMVRQTLTRPRSLREYQENPFPGNPLWQYQAIENVCAWIVQKSSE
ncbi:MAG TPA: hypothetical protein VHY08_07525 [Bacillota bacterium]|nr:hypothetical protein [Bacillota bacterium]